MLKKGSLNVACRRAVSSYTLALHLIKLLPGIISNKLPIKFGHIFGYSVLAIIAIANAYCNAT